MEVVSFGSHQHRSSVALSVGLLTRSVGGASMRICENRSCRFVSLDLSLDEPREFDEYEHLQ